MPVASVANLFAQIRGLQDGTIAPSVRALTNTLADWTDLARGAEPPAEQVERAFMLHFRGIAVDSGSLISAPLRSQWLAFEEDVSVFLGAGEDGTQDYGQQQIDLLDLCEEIRDVLEAPSNQSRATTGIVEVRFPNVAMSGEYVTRRRIENGRLTVTMPFTVLYERTEGAA